MAVGLVFVASSCGLIGMTSPVGAANPHGKPTTTIAGGGGSTTAWQGNGTNSGFCAGFSAGLIGVPPGDQGWLFVLTSPKPGPWELTAKFAHSGTVKVAGTQQGNHGSVQFEVNSLVGDQLLSASSTNGGHNLIVGGCTLGPKGGPYGPSTQPTTVTPTTIPPVKTKGQPASGIAFTPATAPSSVAFTGAELALMFSIGAIAIGVGGVLVLVGRRRRSEPAYARDERERR